MTHKLLLLIKILFVGLMIKEQIDLGTVQF